MLWTTVSEVSSFVFNFIVKWNAVKWNASTTEVIHKVTEARWVFLSFKTIF